jgi:hypothetical protein
VPARLGWTRAPLRSLSPVFDRQTTRWLELPTTRDVARGGTVECSRGLTNGTGDVALRVGQPSLIGPSGARAGSGGTRAVRFARPPEPSAWLPSRTAGLASRAVLVCLQHEGQRRWFSLGFSVFGSSRAKGGRCRIWLSERTGQGGRTGQASMALLSNKGMKLTKLRAAPVRRAEVPPCARAAGMDAGTASQLIPGVRPTFEAK